MSARRTAVVVGATGLVGGRVLQQLVSDPGVARISAPVRREVSLYPTLSRVRTPRIDFGDLDAHAPSFRGCQVFLCLGTTMARAGSREAFRRVDHDLTLACARKALEGGARDAFLVSSIGANPTSRAFYLRVKGDVEEALTELPFRSVHLFRPGVISGPREQVRPAERALIALGHAVGPLLVGRLRRHRPIAADTIAAAMVDRARDPGEGAYIYESEEIADLAAA